jgi:hypothetical protein
LCAGIWHHTDFYIKSEQNTCHIRIMLSGQHAPYP